MSDLVRERPIMFAGAMVRALLAGTKTQTRRLATSPLRKCSPGDLLWVRETFTQTQYGKAVYRADGCDQTGARWPISPGDPYSEVKWRPSIHMPRSACRLTLRVTEVRFQRLHDITEEDAQAEGVDLPRPNEAGCDYVDVYAALWSDLHGPDSWNANPEVVAITFEMIRDV